ncbi:DUF4383 domain-containing protein [Luedemannella flava]|uniref:DUF4383 domain-containing protein n=1 Tax=Luedemannella flava TaxID=349316 RepID=UPI003CD0989E
MNHPLRPLYRVLAGLAGLYVLAFGIVGLTKTSGMDFFAQDDLPVALGLKTNPAFALLSVIVGAIVVVGAVIGRNVDRFINLTAGVVFLLAGMVMLVLSRTDLNFLGFQVATCVASFIIGGVFATAGLYGKVGTPEHAAMEEGFRHGTPDPTDHKWKFHGPPKDPDRASSRFA